MSDLLTFLLLCLVQCLVAWPIALGFFMPGCYACNCTPAVCGIASSTFTSLTGFTQVAGTWSATSNRAQTTSANAVLSCNTVHPGGASADRTVIATLSATALGDKARLVVDYVDTDNYVAVEVEFGSGSTCGQVRVVSRLGGVETTVGDTINISGALVNFNLKVTAFYKPGGGDENLRVQLSTDRQFWRTVTAAGGDKVAFATSTLTGTARFSAFTFSYHFTSGAPSCTSPICTIHSGVQSCDYTVVSGTFNSSLVCSADGILLSNFPNWADDHVVAVTANLSYPSAAGHEFGIVLDYLDSNNYHFCAIQFVSHDAAFSTTGFKLVIKQVSGGATTTLATSETFFKVVNNSVYGLMPLVAYLAEDNITVKMTLDSGFSGRRGEMMTTATITPSDGKQAGVQVSGLTGAETCSLTSFAFEQRALCGEASNAEKVSCSLITPCVSSVSGRSNNTSKLPNGWKVVISGVVNNTGCVAPNDCASVFNGTHILPEFSMTGYSGSGTNRLGCHASKYTDASPCILDDPQVRVELFSDRVEVVLAAGAYGTDGSAYFDANVSGKWTYTLDTNELCDLTTLTDVAMSYTSGSQAYAGCTTTSATVVLTAL